MYVIRTHIVHILPNLLGHAFPHCTYDNRAIGNVLLKNPQGERVREIQIHNRHGNSKAVLYDIFQTWLTEDEQATWEKLVQHLYKASLSHIAEGIETRLRMFSMMIHHVHVTYM